MRQLAVSPLPARPRTGTAVLVALALLAAFALPGIAGAHANIDRAEPAPDSILASGPRMVHIWFTEPLAPNASGIQVLDSRSRRVDSDDSRVDPSDPRLMMVSLPPLPNGTYTVAWHNTSTVDGHPLRGTYAFSVGEAPPPGTSGASASTTSAVSPLEPVARWAVLGGLLVALGVVGFSLVILAPVIAAREARATPIAIDRRIVAVALGVFAVGAVIHLALQPAGEAGLAGLVTGTRWGQLWALRAAL
ncbi:MAG: copper resistance protein CopC, partial [Chloroflexi bacterium]|nr:copper resistance protein CopC [Chloroflexota bacterium]